MREIRQSGSEGGVAFGPSLPLSVAASSISSAARAEGGSNRNEISHRTPEKVFFKNRWYTAICTCVTWKMHSTAGGYGDGELADFDWAGG